ncbi:MAG: hypothetical protein RDU14_03815 [Melioribacteraceae bacterium]|nr:hypothetical protein [Melioribacteraceae bacterium]
MVTKVSYCRRYFIYLLILLFTNFMFNSCSSFKMIAPTNDMTIKIYRISTIDGKIIDFKNSELGYATIVNNELVYYKTNYVKEIISLTDIKFYYTKELDTTKTIFGIVYTAAFVVVVVLIVLSSISGHKFGG